jgi:probable selenium-dependent hydroxylase accessory protein YqeC
MVVVEADGARHLSAKAPAAHEPVLPHGCTVVVVMAGLDAIGQPIQAAVHRPKIAAALLGCASNAPLTPERLSALLTHPKGGLKNVPDAARVVVCLNKADTPALTAVGHAVAARVNQHPRIDRVVVTSLRG